MKYAILVGDGMADYPLPELKGKTPLEVAKTPHMDYIAKEGKGGLLKTIPEGKPPGSDIANLEILGYSAEVYFTGRAPLEAASRGIKLENDEVAFRCNFITAEGRKISDYSAGHITTKEASELIGMLSERLGNDKVRFYSGRGYRNFLLIKGQFDRLQTKAPHDIMGQRIEENLPEGEEAGLVRNLILDSGEILKEAELNKKRISEGKPPANMIWLWGQGKALNLPHLKETLGISGGVIAAVDLIRGIGVSAGLVPIDVPGATGYIDTDYLKKGEYALNALHSMDFIYLHVEAPDEASHNGDLKSKIETIENFDKKVVGRVLGGADDFETLRIMVLPDHYTPLSVRTHTSEPVPFAIFPSDDPGKLKGFSETEMRKTGWTVDPGHKLIEEFID